MYQLLRCSHIYRVISVFLFGKHINSNLNTSNMELWKVHIAPDKSVYSQNICLISPEKHTRVLQKVLSLGSYYFSATFYQTYFYYKPSKYSPFTETHFCNLFTQSQKADKIVFFWYLVETRINSAAKRTSRRIHVLISR